MFYLENYGPYAELIKSGGIIVENTSITKENWNQHFNSILNILRDGIETQEIRNSFITVRFGSLIDVDLSIPDYFHNLQMWYLIVIRDGEIRPNNIIFDKGVTRKSIKAFIDDFFVDIVRKKLDTITINNMIDDCLYSFRHIDEFSMYLANTINLEDFIKLMKENPRFNDIIHADLSAVPLDKVKDVGMDLARESIEYIKNSDHCLANFFIANEGVNPKQYKEFAINIGTKPNGNGGVYPVVVNTNFISGGVNDPMSYIIESSTGRTAQIIVEGNVGTSGHFARLLGLNNMDTVIHPDPNYICDSQNFQEQFITDSVILSGFENRYYRMSPTGMEYLLTKHDTHLIGQTIYLRSPMTCASHARGKGICYRCYGDLVYTNKDINIGKLAAELMSSILTQMMLSAKHLLESAIKKMEWGNDFYTLLDIEYNMLKLKDDVDYTGYKLIIDPNNITIENEDDEENRVEREFNEFIPGCSILTPDGIEIPINTKNYDNLYITNELNGLIRNHGVVHNDNVCLDLSLVKDEEIFLFAVQIHNNDLSKTLDKINSILNKAGVTESMNRHELLQALNQSLKEGGLNISSIHGEVILSNQLRNSEDILATPEWQYPNEPCMVLALKKALSNNPSISISLSFQGISKQLFSPLTYRKNKPSFMDLFLMEKPQLYLNNTEEIQKADPAKYNDNGLQQIVFYVDKPQDEEIESGEEA